MLTQLWSLFPKGPPPYWLGVDANYRGICLLELDQDDDDLWVAPRAWNVPYDR